MTTGPDGERRQEPTFADVMNGFGLDSGRPVRRRLFGRRRGAPAEPENRAPVRPATATPAPGPSLDPFGGGGRSAGGDGATPRRPRPSVRTRGPAAARSRGST